MILTSNCCGCPIQEVVAPAVVIFDVEIEESGYVSHSMIPLIEGDISGYRCTNCGDYFTNSSGNITDVTVLVEYLKGEQKK